MSGNRAGRVGTRISNSVLSPWPHHYGRPPFQISTDNNAPALGNLPLVSSSAMLLLLMSD
jgi:hypothetical protein